MFAACEENDLGATCEPPEDETDQSTDVGSGGTNEVTFRSDERKDARCEWFSCVSTLVRANYCSMPCVANEDCPSGFLCDQLWPVAEFADRRFCLLTKPCTPGNSTDCPKDMACVEKATSDPNFPAYFCDQTKPQVKPPPSAPAQ